MAKKVSTKPKARNVEADFFNSMTPGWGDGTPASDAGETKDVKKAEQPDVSALLEQIKGLNDRVERAERTNFALMQQPPAAAAVIPERKAPQLDLKGLPDPSVDPEGYARGVLERTQQVVTAQVQDYTTSQRGELDRQKAADDLWARFAKTHEEYAEDQEKVEFAAQKVAGEAKSRGMDLQRYMFGPGSEQFMSDVARKMDEVFGKPGGGKDPDEEDEGSDEGRSTSIFGGIESGGRPGARGRQEDAGDMLKDLREMQRKTGFF